MGRALNRLSATQVRAINAPGYFADGGNLFLQVSAFGTKSWLFRFTRAGKTREMGLGALADVSLAEARQKASEVRKMLRDGVDPIEQRKAARSLMVATSATALTFEQTAKAFIKAKESEWKNAKHGAQWHYTLEQFAYPIIGKVLVRDVSWPNSCASSRGVRPAMLPPTIAPRSWRRRYSVAPLKPVPLLSFTINSGPLGDDITPTCGSTVRSVLSFPSPATAQQFKPQQAHLFGKFTDYDGINASRTARMDRNEQLIKIGGCSR